MEGYDAGPRREAAAISSADFFVDKWLCRRHSVQDEGWDEFETLLTMPSTKGDDSTLAPLATAAVRKNSRYVEYRREEQDEQQPASNEVVASASSVSKSTSKSRSKTRIVAWQDEKRVPETGSKYASIAKFPPRLSSKEIEENFNELRFREVDLCRVVAEIKAIGVRMEREAYFRALQEELEAMDRELEKNILPR